MSTPAYALDNPLVNHLRHREDGLAELGRMDMYALITPDTVSLDYVGMQRVPTLRLKGMISGLEPMEHARSQAQLYGIDSVDFAQSIQDADDRPRLVRDYEFSDEQFKVLIDKGLYRPGFQPPYELFTSEQWMLPVTTNLYVSQPARPDEPAVLLYQIENLHQDTLTLENSGYDLAAYFTTVAREQTGPETENEQERERAYGKDMFAEHAFEEQKIAEVGQAKYEKEAEEHAHERTHVRLQYLAGTELEFTEIYQELYPTEDHVPGDIRAEREALRALIRDREGDSVLDKFRVADAQDMRVFEERRIGLGEQLQVDPELEGEDFSDLLAEDETVDVDAGDDRDHDDRDHDDRDHDDREEDYSDLFTDPEPTVTPVAEPVSAEPVSTEAFAPEADEEDEEELDSDDLFENFDETGHLRADAPVREADREIYQAAHADTDPLIDVEALEITNADEYSGVEADLSDEDRLARERRRERTARVARAANEGHSSMETEREAGSQHGGQRGRPPRPTPRGKDQDGPELG